jgi:hypothetical protein
MNTHADKTQENKSQSVSAAGSQIQSSVESAFQFIDNRPEAIAQRKLQEMANNSPQVKQAAQLQAMADNHSAQHSHPVQRKLKRVEGQKYSHEDVERGNVKLQDEGGGKYRVMDTDIVVFYDTEDDYYYTEDAEYNLTIVPIGNDAQQQANVAPALAIEPAYRNVGVSGRGVMNVTTPTTLHVAGLNSCVGVLMIAPNAAFVSHILVGLPLLSSGDGVADHMRAVLAAFTENSGVAPTTIALYIDPSNPHYGIREPRQMEHIRAMLSVLPGAEIRQVAAFEHVQQPNVAVADPPHTWTTNEVPVPTLDGERLAAARGVLNQDAERRAAEREKAESKSGSE